MTIAEIIIFERKKRGWTQAELGEKCCLTRITICRYENGNMLPRKPQLIRVASAFGYSYEQFMSIEIPSKPSPTLIDIEPDIPLQDMVEVNIAKLNRLNLQGNLKAGAYLDGLLESEEHIQ